ncbi:DUF2975 domain-containing protein [Chryseobacterium sp. L7]|uniref:DUF2975 domain-containing protein n=1 Tax=Chryseobacterium endalhagicum TaxID=2797638 RepID=A0ABS1QAW8_9FLAO|nr:DUF2975 domain-containing protein [Chryseobacterium endalhagicum]MBL1219446.1 DUF2975 domain-containing protein [Chryseobacterium endalhagicum]
MKIIGKHSLVSWIKVPLSIFAGIFCISSIWICSLAFSHAFAGISGSNISERIDTINEKTYNTLQVHYPFSNMVLTMNDSKEGVLLALLNIISLSFSLVCASKIINGFSTEHIFSSRVIKDFKILSYGLILLGFITLLIDLALDSTHFDFTPPFLSIGIGVTLLIIKEICVQGNDLKEQTDLTI